MRPTPLRIAVATVIGSLYLVVGTLFWSTAAIFAALIPPRGKHAHWVARTWARGILVFGFVPLVVEHEVALDPRARHVFLANHQSLFDIPALLVAIPGQVRFLAKASLFKIPIFGWAMRLAGFVPVDRSDRRSARGSFSAALDRLGRGMSILVFPEERRSLDGRLLPFKRGGLLLAVKSGLPIVPVGVEGTLAVQSLRSFLIRPQTVHVRFGRPIAPPESVRELPELAESLRARIGELARAELAADEAVPPVLLGGEGGESEMKGRPT